MKTNIMNERDSDKSIGDALAKGALLWAPVYAIAASSVVWGLTAKSPESASYAEILLKAMLVFSPLCIAAEACRWMLLDKLPQLKRIGFEKRQPPKLQRFVPPGAKMRRKHA
ncbi:hypothetical protein [Pontiella agarivorans]|uniref:Uncharacterized protein n=1 Tax=Pontiella agarivorans TaxID=3038953 RepID=A0ABU5N0S6_9BACT|nr:hypothetical protein [Pontiella agarivorans]MDZ8120042.1 hypothetical protein [Pontiella agarivorans]